MRCAVVRASKGYHSFKINNTYIYFSFPFIHHLNPSVTSQSTQIHHLYSPCITQHPSVNSTLTKFHLSILQSNNTTTTTLTLTYRCIVPPRCIQASILHYMIWHCVPLHNEGTISLSGNLQRGNPNSVSITERERLGSPVPNNRRSLSLNKLTYDPRSNQSEKDHQYK